LNYLHQAITGYFLVVPPAAPGLW